MTEILSYNLNGIRSAIDKGLFDFLKQGQYDIICIQETKAQPEQVDLSPLTELGYTAYWHSALKKGYSGVLTLTKKPPTEVVTGMGIPEFDDEGRVLRTDFGDVTLLNCYFPSGASGDTRQEVKMRFLADFQTFIEQLKQTRSQIIVAGDYNIAHTEIDILDPKGNKNNSGFLPEERAWMTQWLDHVGFTDVFRHVHPTEVLYSWWSFRFQSRAKNKGWRIDYQCVTPPLKDKIRASTLLNDANHSDHCPVWAQYDF